MYENETEKNNPTWFSGNVMHKGFPLHLRFPDKPDFDTLQTKFPDLLIVTHHIAEVTSSGVPEATYNASLEELDHDLIHAFSKNHEGLTALIETFSGKRIYYMYISHEAQIDSIREHISNDYPQHQLEWESKNDPDWNFIRKYSTDYKFYKNG